MNLEIAEKPWSERGVTLVLKGEIDVYTAAQVRQKVHEVVDAGRTFIVANLQEVTYLDSTGLGVLIGALRRTREREGNLVVVCSNPRLVRIFEITGLAKIFRIYEDEPIALAAVVNP
ncbi:MAG TPA: STAS domain-containing protein [Armatimonadota bacterium]|nr:STAS domain-containing protein [Armatimonadota bacterium]